MTLLVFTLSLSTLRNRNWRLLNFRPTLLQTTLYSGNCVPRSLVTIPFLDVSRRFCAGPPSPSLSLPPLFPQKHPPESLLSPEVSWNRKIRPKTTISPFAFSRHRGFFSVDPLTHIRRLTQTLWPVHSAAGIFSACPVCTLLFSALVTVQIS